MSSLYKNIEYLESDNKGFTLIELLIAVTIFSLILLFIATVFIQINRAYTQGLITKQTQEAGREVLETVKRDFRTASSSGQLRIECVDQDECDSPEEPTQRLCFDSKAYNFTPPDSDAGIEGQFIFDANANCAEEDPDLNAGLSMFGDDVQPQFFKVSEVVPDRTYKLELMVSTASYSDDLLAEVDEDAGEGVRDIACTPGVIGSEFCNIVSLDTLVTLRNE